MRVLFFGRWRRRSCAEIGELFEVICVERSLFFVDCWILPTIFAGAEF